VNIQAIKMYLSQISVRQKRVTKKARNGPILLMKTGKAITTNITERRIVNPIQNGL
jgi:hypothetical protein